MSNMMFDVKKVKIEMVEWLKEWFNKNGPDCNAVIGISGGKDSSVVAALCVEALGKDRVIGVMMPNGYQNDINYSKELIDFLGIKSYEINIYGAYHSLIGEFESNFDAVSEQTKVNLPARLRMSALYGVSQSHNGRVIGCANYSEGYVGYFTRWDLSDCCDVSPIAQLTVAEVKALGRELGLPDKFVEKIPSDGLSGKTDEDNLGFSYSDVDSYLRKGFCDNENVEDEIVRKHNNNLFKFKPVDSFPN